MLKLLLVFIIGGFVVSSVSYLSDSVNNYYAAILWAFPFTLLPTIYFLQQQGKSNLYISDFLIKSSISILILVGVLITLSYAIRFYSINMTIFISFLVYFVLAMLFIKFIKINEPKG